MDDSKNILQFPKHVGKEEEIQDYIAVYSTDQGITTEIAGNHPAMITLLFSTLSLEIEDYLRKVKDSGKKDED